MQLMKMTKLGRNRFVIDFHFKKTNTDILLAFSIIIKNRWETPRKLLDLKWPIFYETFISIGFVKHTYDSIKETDDSDAFWTTLLSVNKFSVKTFSHDEAKKIDYMFSVTRHHIEIICAFPFFIGNIAHFAFFYHKAENKCVVHALCFLTYRWMPTPLFSSIGESVAHIGHWINQWSITLSATIAADNRMSIEGKEKL